MFIRLRRLVVALMVLDMIATQLALWVAELTRLWLPFGAELGDAPTSAFLVNPAIRVAVALIFPVTFATLAVYDVRRGSRPVGDPTHLLRAVMVAVFVFAGFLYFTFREVPRLLVIYFFLLELAATAGGRLLLGLWLKWRQKSGQFFSRVLLVGTGEAAQAVVLALQSRLGDTVQIVGCVDDAAEGLSGVPLLGQLADTVQIAQRHTIDEVVLALPSERYAAAESLAYALLTEPVRVRLVPDFLRLVVVQSSVEMLGDLPLIGLREPRITGLAWATKRIFDVVVTTLLLVISWPLLVVIAVLIKLDSPGPVIFRQKRVGENGRLFAMYKFRTMVADAETRGQRPKTAHDERVTRVGRFLRRASLDELPQFWNIIKGEMSLVGPRPEVQWIVDQYQPWQRQRLAVPPGLTGWWQVNGRSDLPMHLNTHLDLYYIRNYSLWLDCVILFKTVGVVLRRQGAY